MGILNDIGATVTQTAVDLKDWAERQFRHHPTRTYGLLALAVASFFFPPATGIMALVVGAAWAPLLTPPAILLLGAAAKYALDTLTKNFVFLSEFRAKWISPLIMPIDTAINKHPILAFAILTLTLAAAFFPPLLGVFVGLQVAAFAPWFAAAAVFAVTSLVGWLANRGKPEDGSSTKKGYLERASDYVISNVRSQPWTHGLLIVGLAIVGAIVFPPLLATAIPQLAVGAWLNIMAAAITAALAAVARAWNTSCWRCSLSSH